MQNGWTKVIEQKDAEIAALKADVVYIRERSDILIASQAEEIDSQFKEITILKAEIGQLKFGHEPLPCPSTDKSGFSTFPARSDTMEIL